MDLQAAVRAEGVPPDVVRARKTKSLPVSGPARVRRVARIRVRCRRQVVEHAREGKTCKQKWRSRHSSLRRYDPTSDPWRGAVAREDLGMGEELVVSPPWCDAEYAARARREYAAVQRGAVVTNASVVSTGSPGRKCDSPRRAVCERRFRNRMVRTHAVRKLGGDVQQWEKKRQACAEHSIPRILLKSRLSWRSSKYVDSRHCTVVLVWCLSS